jgi:hypothetical protein
MGMGMGMGYGVWVAVVGVVGGAGRRGMEIFLQGSVFTKGCKKLMNPRAPVPSGDRPRVCEASIT